MPSSDLELQKMPIYTETRIVTHSIKCESNANREYRTPQNSTTNKRAFHNVRKYIIFTSLCPSFIAPEGTYPRGVRDAFRQLVSIFTPRY